MIVGLPHETAGTVTVMGVPVRLSATPGAATTAPPRLGEHTDLVLARVLGLKASAITRLRESGAVA
jgi:crotonobetainyl-CoA:carnitine CoA-transferase CaiB-like acyl-CoA transferase